MIIKSKSFSFILCVILILCNLSFANANWPMFHNNKEHTGFTDYEGPANGTLLWSKSLGTDIGASSPAVVNGRAYITDFQTGRIFCLNAYNGTQLWSYQTGGRIFSSSPAIANNLVFVGSRDNFLYCLNSNNGSLVWRFDAGEWIENSPTTFNDFVSIIANGNVYCIYQENGTLKWNYSLPSGYNIRSSVSVSSDYVYVLSNSLYCLDKNTGELEWSFYIPPSSYSTTPTLYNDRVYVGDYYGKFYCIDATPDDNQDGLIDENDNDEGAEDLFSHDLIWQQEIGVFVASTAAVYDEKVYVGAYGTKTIYCFDANSGDEIWNFSEKPMANQLDSSPAIANEKVYFGTGTGSFYCLDANSGSIIWNYSADGGVYSSPAIFDGRLYFGSRHGTLYCFGDNSVPMIPDVPGGFSSGVIAVEYDFSTSVVIDPDGHSVEYQFYWDDGSTSIWNQYPSATHYWGSVGTYNIKVRARDELGLVSDWSESFEISIEEEQSKLDLKSLEINSPLSIMEENYFSVIIKAEGELIEDVKVSFNDQQKYTNKQGSVTILSPIVENDNTFAITATKTGYLPAIETIIVKNKKETKSEGIVYGTIFCDGSPLKSVEITISNENENWIYYSDLQGRYVITLAVGNYQLSVKKEGYEEKFEDIQILENNAIGIDFNLEINQDSNIQDNSEDSNQIIDYVINQKIKEKVIGAKISVLKNDETVTYYSEDIYVTLNSIEENEINFLIGSEEEIEGKFIIVNIGKGSLSDLNNIVLKFDGEEISEFSNIEEFFSLDDDQQKGWMRVLTTEGLYIFIRVPHFSEHTISISSFVETFFSPIAILFYTIICLIGISSFMYPFVIWPYKIRKSKK